MSAPFSTACDLVDVLGGEAMWRATFTTGKSASVSMCATKALAEQWLVDKTAEFMGERVVLEAPDGDGVVVSPHHGHQVVYTAPAVAVRVREASPMASMPQVAAQVAERVYYAQWLLDEAEQVLADAGMGGDFAPMVWKAQKQMATLVEYSACEVLEQLPPDAQVVAEAPRHLSAVPDGGAA